MCFARSPVAKFCCYPPALSVDSLARVRGASLQAMVRATERSVPISSVNAVSVGRQAVMKSHPDRLRWRCLPNAVTRCEEVDLSPFMMSAAARFCMTLRLDRHSAAAAVPTRPWRRPGARHGPVQMRQSSSRIFRLVPRGAVAVGQPSRALK